MYDQIKILMQYTLFPLDSPNFTKLYLFKNKTDLGSIYQTIDWTSLTKLLPEKKTMATSESRLAILNEASAASNDALVASRTSKTSKFNKWVDKRVAMPATSLSGVSSRKDSSAW